MIWEPLKHHSGTNHVLCAIQVVQSSYGPWHHPRPRHKVWALMWWCVVLLGRGYGGFRLFFYLRGFQWFLEVWSNALVRATLAIMAVSVHFYIWSLLSFYCRNRRTMELPWCVECSDPHSSFGLNLMQNRFNFQKKAKLRSRERDFYSSRSLKSGNARLLHSFFGEVQ